MPEQVLHRPDVHSALKQVGGKRMSKRVATGSFCDPSLFHRLSELPSHRILMKMVPGDTARPGMWAEFGGRKHILPDPLLAGVGIFPHQSLRHVGFTASRSQIPLMHFPGIR